MEACEEPIAGAARGGRENTKTGDRRKTRKYEGGKAIEIRQGGKESRVRGRQGK